MSTFEDANCAGHDTETFFPMETDRAGTRAAKAICAGCPAQRACLDFAMDSERAGRQQRHGIYGGLSPRQRADLSRRTRKESAA